MPGRELPPVRCFECLRAGDDPRALPKQCACESVKGFAESLTLVSLTFKPCPLGLNECFLLTSEVKASLFLSPADTDGHLQQKPL